MQGALLDSSISTRERSITTKCCFCESYQERYNAYAGTERSQLKLLSTNQEGLTWVRTMTYNTTTHQSMA
jgi:hypothetical protein